MQENQQPKQRKLKTKSLDSLKMSTPLLGTWEEQLANLAKAGEKTQAKEAAEADTKEVRRQFEIWVMMNKTDFAFIRYDLRLCFDEFNLLADVNLSTWFLKESVLKYF